MTDRPLRRAADQSHLLHLQHQHERSGNSKSPSPVGDLKVDENEPLVVSATGDADVTADDTMEEELAEDEEDEAVLKDDDTELDRVFDVSLQEIFLFVSISADVDCPIDLIECAQDLLQRARSIWSFRRCCEFLSHSIPRIEPDSELALQSIIPSMKRSTLERTYLVFSGLVALGTRPEDSEYWKLAETFGAKCGNDLREGVTHLVANQVRYSSLRAISNRTD